MAAVRAPVLRPHGRTRPLAIRVLREWFGLSQGELAQALGVSRATVNRWERTGHAVDPASAAGRLLTVMAEIRELGLRQAASHDVRAWLGTRVPALGGRTPRDVLLTQGPVPVRDVLLAAWEGAYS